VTSMSLGAHWVRLGAHFMVNVLLG
jgi:hypothetical protein